MILTLLLSQFTFCKITRANSKTFDRAIKKNPITIVLFSSNKCLPCKRISSIMDSVSDRYTDSIGFLSVEYETSQQIPVKYNISYVPTIAVFRDGNFRTIYTGEWTQQAIGDLCETLVNSDMVFLNSSFEIFKFQHLLPANLIISSPKAAANADGLIDSFAGLIHIGVIEDPKLSEELQFPTAVFSRPNDHFTENLSSIDIDHISSLLSSPYNFIQNMEQLSASNDVSLLALLDSQDPLHVRDAVNTFSAVRDYFGDNLTYQYCDFFRCSSLVNQMRIIMFNNPIYALSIRQGQRSRFEPYMEMNPLPQNILNFAKFHLLGIPMPVPKKVFTIPKLYAPEFISVVGNPNHNVILFIASPEMIMYEECLKKTRALAQSLKSVSSVKFYEFNPLTEHVQGLDMPKSTSPQYSVWPAAKTPHGSSFIATVDVDMILDNFLKLITDKIEQEDLKKIRKSLKKYMKEQEQED